MAEAIRARIRSELLLPASVGAATALYLAKMASGYAKPDGLHIVTEGSEKAFLEHLDVQELWGVGKATRSKLASMGIGTIGQLARVSPPLLRRHLGEATGDHLHRLANGIDERVVEPGGAAKSISVEQTFEHDISGAEALRSQLLRQADQVAWRLRRAGLSGRTVSLKLRFPDFRTITRAETLRSATDVSRELYRSCCRLLDRTDVGGRPVRLLGVAVSGLQTTDAPRQLMAGHEERWENLAETVDDIRVRFGRHAVEPARLRSGESDPAYDARD